MALVSRLRFASQARRVIVFAVLVIALFLLVAMNRFRTGSEFFIWYPLVLAGLYWWVAAQDQKHRNHTQLEVALEACTD